MQNAAFYCLARMPDGAKFHVCARPADHPYIPDACNQHWWHVCDCGVAFTVDAETPKHWVPAGLSPDAMYALGYEHGRKDAGISDDAATSWIRCDRHGWNAGPDTPKNRAELAAAGWLFDGDSQVCFECAQFLARGDG